MEKDYIYEITTEISELNENGHLKPYVYQNLFAKIAEQHLDKVNLNIDTTMKYNLAWVLISLSLEVVTPVSGCIKMYAQTWFSNKKGPYYRRELIFRDEKGNVLFKGSTFSILLDLTTRTVYRKKDTPFYMSSPINEITITATPSYKTSLTFKEIDRRKVYNSYIDWLGHVNNIRYGEFAYDALTEGEKRNLDRLKRYEIFFLAELKNNDEFSISRAKEADNIIIKGTNLKSEQTSFEVVMNFCFT